MQKIRVSMKTCYPWKHMLYLAFHTLINLSCKENTFFWMALDLAITKLVHSFVPLPFIPCAATIKNKNWQKLKCVGTLHKVRSTDWKHSYFARPIWVFKTKDWLDNKVSSMCITCKNSYWLACTMPFAPVPFCNIESRNLVRYIFRSSHIMINTRIDTSN